MVKMTEIEGLISQHGIQVTRGFHSEVYRIFSCLDGQDGSEQLVMLPHEALDQSNWSSLLFCFFSIAIIATFLFRDNSRSSWISSMADSLFFFYSDLLSNDCTTLYHRSSISWRLFISGWLLGASVILQKGYLCNLKGELATVKVKYVDTLEDVLNRPDINEYYADVDLWRFKNETKSPGNIEFFANAKEAWIFQSDVQSDVIRRKSALVGRSKYFPPLLSLSVYCDNVYMGKKDYFSRSTNVFLSAHVPPIVQETVRYRVSRFVDTQQLGPSEMYNEFQFNRMNKTDSQIPPKPIAMYFLMPIFRVFFGGMSISVVALCLETAAHYFRGRKSHLPEQRETKPWGWIRF